MKNIRACASCGKERHKKELLRLIRSPNGDLVVDWRSNLGGRATHVCPIKKCIAGAVPEQSLETLLKGIKESYLRQISTLVASCKSRHALSPGTDEATKAIKANRAHLLILAHDFSSRSNLETLSNQADIPSSLLGTKEILGNLTGRPPTGILAICNQGLAEALITAIDHYTALV